MEVIKITKKVHKVLAARAEPYLTFLRYRLMRENAHLRQEKRCFNCGHRFQDEEQVHPVILSGTYYARLFCDECNKKALEDLKK